MTIPASADNNGEDATVEVSDVVPTANMLVDDVESASYAETKAVLVSGDLLGGLKEAQPAFKSPPPVGTKGTTVLEVISDPSPPPPVNSQEDAFSRMVQRYASTAQANRRDPNSQLPKADSSGSGDFCDCLCKTATNSGHRSILICLSIACLFLIGGFGFLAWYGSKTGTKADAYGSTVSGGYGSCFPKGELVQLENAQESRSVPIEDLKPGSVAREGGLVTAVFKILPAQGEAMYRYNQSAWVTGSHSVFEDSNENALTLNHVKDSALASIVPTGHFWNPDRDYLNNLVTKTHRVVINGTLFSDWEEQDFCSKNLLRRFNKPEDIIDEDETDLSCQGDAYDEGSFAAGTMISVDASKSVAAPIESLNPGDRIEGGVVLAVVQVYENPGESVYRLHAPTSNNFIEATKWTVVRDDDGEWRYIQDSKNAVHHGTIDEEDAVYYQLITSSHRIVTESGSMCADYEIFDEPSGASALA